MEDLSLLAPDSLRALLCGGRDLGSRIGFAFCLCGVELSRWRYFCAILLTDVYDDEVLWDAAIDRGARFIGVSFPSDAAVTAEVRLLL
jgi:hypothetical protein